MLLYYNKNYQEGKDNDIKYFGFIWINNKRLEYLYR